MPEEFYHFSKDPDALNNLINNKANKTELVKLQQALETWMAKTNDPALEVFKKRHDAQTREEYVKQREVVFGRKKQIKK